MGSLFSQVVAHDAWALWLAAPACGIALVCLAVWWWSRPARPASTAHSIAGHHAYLDALTRDPREKVPAPAADHPAPVVDPLAHAVILDATDDVDDPEPAVTVRA